MAPDRSEPLNTTQYVVNGDGDGCSSDAHQDVVEQIFANESVHTLEQNETLNRVNNDPIVHFHKNRSLTDDQSFEGIPEIFSEYCDVEAERPDSLPDSRLETAASSRSVEEPADSVHNNDDAQIEQDVIDGDNEENDNGEDDGFLQFEEHMHEILNQLNAYSEIVLLRPESEIKREALLLVNSRIRELFMAENRSDHEGILLLKYINFFRNDWPILDYIDLLYIALYRDQPEFSWLERIFFQV